MSRLSQKHFYVIGPVLFLQHPQLRGAWIRTDRCVILVPCPQCNAARGELCVGSQGAMATTHYKRRDAAPAEIQRLLEEGKDFRDGTRAVHLVLP